MRIVVNLSSGDTIALQLPEELGIWQRHASDPGFQGSIRGVGVIRGTEHIVIPAPKLFKGTTWDIETFNGEGDVLRGVSILCMSDDVMVKGTVYNTGSPSMTKFEVKRIGKRRWKPSEETHGRGASRGLHHNS